MAKQRTWPLREGREVYGTTKLLKTGIRLSRDQGGARVGGGGGG